MNQKTKIIEPILASTQFTPKLLKLPFGAITDFADVVKDLIEIFNKSEEVLQLNTKDSQMKKVLC